MSADEMTMGGTTIADAINIVAYLVERVRIDGLTIGCVQNPMAGNEAKKGENLTQNQCFSNIFSLG